MTWTAGTYERFIYDDNYNRAGSDGTRNITQDPFGNEAGVDDDFAINKANEYTSVVRGSSGTSVSHDAAGNMTAVPVIPGAGPSAGAQVTASITWDAFNRARGIQAGSSTTFAYCYDAFGRRIAQWDAETADNLMGRRYIWDKVGEGTHPPARFRSASSATTKWRPSRAVKSGSRWSRLKQVPTARRSACT